MFKKFVNLMKDEIVNSTCELIKIPSIYSNDNISSMPFGKNCAKALEYILDLGKNLGFRTKNIDGYCGYIEFGSGDDLIGIIGHLDVVPEGENWTFPPFNATIHNNKIYGRGAIDDKGPVISSLYAMKIIMDNFKINKRVRLILGLNEENDWKCIEYYKKHEEIPNIGFSPDADFPCIYAEKALLNVHLKQNYSSNNDIVITDIDYGNNPINVVPKFCSLTLEIKDNLNINTCVEQLNTIIRKYNHSITVNLIDLNHICLSSIGCSAHAAHPELGLNAISNLLVVIYEFLKLYNIHIEIISKFYDYINMQYNGKNLKINYEDESGNLTLNVAKFFVKNSSLVISMNLRIPVSIDISEIKTAFISYFKSSCIDVYFDGEKPGLYIPKENKLVSTLCNIFNEVTNQNKTPIAIGGATYARAFPNCVSFGASMPDDKDMCHQVDEFISIDNLILSCEIYAKAIYELTK